MGKKYKSKEQIPKKKASREEQTLAMLAKFKQKLEGFRNDETEEDVSNKGKEEKKTEQNEEDDEDLVGDDWMKNTLVFESDAPILAKDANTKDDDWFDIYDPRNPLNKRRRDKDKVD